MLFMQELDWMLPKDYHPEVLANAEVYTV